MNLPIRPDNPNTISYDRMEELESVMLERPQVECPITHHFMPGIYLREMFVPAGTLILGHEHKTHHGCLLLKGTIRQLSEDGEPVKELNAPLIFLAPPGRKLGFAVTDVIFCNLFATEETDPVRIEEQVVIKSPAWSKKKITEAMEKLIPHEEREKL